MWKTNPLLTGLLSASLAVACSAQSGPINETKPSTGGVVQPMMPREFTLETAVQAARDDAARRTGVAAGSLAVISAEAVTWPDGSIGCPQPGMAYTQALVPGFRIRLRGPTGELDYHASSRGGLVLCPAKRATNPVKGDGGYNSRI
jgi:hypothetical protein